MPVRRIRKAYEQVADQLRELIMSGEVLPSQKLPNEATLAREFGVSRATIREALRVLSTENLLHTQKGTHGGSYITLPTVDRISDLLSANISLLSATENVSLDEFLELRELLEVPAARLAAQRREPTHVHDLRAAIPESPLRMTTEDQFILNRGFHSTLVLATGNALLAIAAQPIFSVLQTNLQRSTLGRKFHKRINEDHVALADAVEAGDEDAAERLMLEHLAFLRPMYEKAWRQARRPARPD
jgi:GntR family transcriptional repressor for pyruvate dehydrogenase complex